MPDDILSADGSSHESRSSGALVAIPQRPNQSLTSAWAVGPPTIPEIINAKPGPVDLLHALRRRWLVGTGLGLIVGGALAAAVWFTMPVRYEVTALLKVLANRQALLASPVGAQDADFLTYKSTQAALVKSNFVLSAMLRKPEIQRLSLIQQHKDDTIGWLVSELIVDYPAAEIMRVSMRGERPNELAKIVNEVKDSYLDEIVNAEREDRLRQRDKLDREYKKSREEIRARMDALHNLHKQLGTQNSETAQLTRNMALKELDLLITLRNSIQAQIGELEMKRRLYETRQKSLETAKLPDSAIEHQINTDPQIMQLKQRLTQTQEVLTEEERRARSPNAKSLTRLRQSVQQLEELIDERRAELRPALLEGFAAYSLDGDEATYLPLLETELTAMNEKLDKINDALKEQLKSLQEMEQYSADIETRTAELLEVQQITQKIGSELKLWGIEIESRPRIQVVEEASVPSSNDAVRKYVAVAFAGVCGFGGVLFGIALLEFQSRRLNSVRDVREGLGIRVIGQLPGLSSRAWRKLQDTKSSAGAHLHSLLSESVDSIRATLMHSSGANPPRVIMISSPGAQEGKTTVASQLAASLARGGRRTLLVDADCRNPSTHLVFGLPLGPGFCEVLREEAERDAAIYATPAQNLWLMPAGQFDAQVLPAISSQILNKLIDSLKEQYDFVIIDSPPVLKVADPLIFGQCVDAAVLSVRRDVSQVPKVYEACERLKAVGVRVLGAIINGVDERPSRHAAPLRIS